jgi:tetratricopeptide (TPR) repeat protein
MQLLSLDRILASVLAWRMDDPEQPSNIFLELARRRVYRAAAAYAVFAWVMIQAASIVFPEFGAPGWAMRALIIVFIAGFPPAMLLAWTLDFSAKGLTRTPDSSYSSARGAWPKLAIALTATAMSAGMLWWVWDGYIVKEPQRTVRRAVKEQPVVAVQEPRRLAGQSEHEWLGDGIATLIRSELAESQHVIVVSRARWRGMTSSLSSPEELSERARSNGIDYLIDGELFETPDGIVLTMHIEDLENGIEMLSPRTSGASVSAILQGVVQLATEIKRALLIPHQERVGMFEADFAIENAEAYEAFIAGLSSYSNFAYAEAEQAFKAALEVAPDYHIARFRLAQVYETTGRTELARATLEQIPTANLSRRLQLYIEGAKAYFTAERDPRKAIEIYSELVQLYPYEVEAGQLLAEAYWLNFQDDAAIAEFRRLSEIHPYDPTSLMALGERLLDVGELDDAKEALEKFAEMEPGDAHAFALLGNLAMLQGNLQTSIEQHQHALSLKPGFVVARLGLARSQYLRGDVAAAEKTWRGILNDNDVAAAFRIDAAFDLAGVLRGRGLFAESLEPYTDTMPFIREERLRLALALSEQGWTHLQAGDPVRAEALIDQAVREGLVPRVRYFFVRGMMELCLGRFDELDSTISEIRRLTDTSNEADRKEEKAANYLQGMAALEKGDLADAAALLQASVDEPGYQYGIYRSGLAMLYRKAGDLERAAALALAAANERDPGDLRLDLELDRARALLLHGEVLAQRGAADEAKQQAQRFLDWWSDADADLPEIARAEALLVE